MDSRRTYQFLGAALVLMGCVSPALAERLLITDIAIVSPEHDVPIIGQDVLIEDGIIAAIGPALPQREGDRIIQGLGFYLTPGLIDSHTHPHGVPGMRGDHIQANPRLYEEAWAQVPRSYLYYGFTTIIDLGGEEWAAEAFGEFDLAPDYEYCAALPFTNGYGMAFTPEEYKFETPYFIYDPAQADAVPAQYDPAAHTPAAVVARARQTDTICVKTFYEPGFGVFDWPTPNKDVFDEVNSAARESELTSLTHAISLEAYEIAAAARVDVVAHGLWDWGSYNGTEGLPDDVTEVLDRLIAQDTGFQFTAQVLYGELALFDPAFLERGDLADAIPQSLLAWYETDEAGWFRDRLLTMAEDHPDAMQAMLGGPLTGKRADVTRAAIDRLGRIVRYVNANGGRILLGSDTPSSPSYTNFPGFNGRMEIRRLHDFGLSPRQIFVAATMSNAEEFGLQHEVGRVAVGLRANLLLMEQDPLQSTAAYDTITAIIIGGQYVERATLSARSD